MQPNAAFREASKQRHAPSPPAHLRRRPARGRATPHGGGLYGAPRAGRTGRGPGSGAVVGMRTWTIHHSLRAFAFASQSHRNATRRVETPAARRALVGFASGADRMAGGDRRTPLRQGTLAAALVRRLGCRRRRQAADAPCGGRPNRRAARVRGARGMSAACRTGPRQAFGLHPRLRRDAPGAERAVPASAAGDAP